MCVEIAERYSNWTRVAVVLLDDEIETPLDPTLDHRQFTPMFDLVIFTGVAKTVLFCVKSFGKSFNDRLPVQ